MTTVQASCHFSKFFLLFWQMMYLLLTLYRLVVVFENFPSIPRIMYLFLTWATVTTTIHASCRFWKFSFSPNNHASSHFGNFPPLLAIMYPLLTWVIVTTTVYSCHFWKFSFSSGNNVPTLKNIIIALSLHLYKYIIFISHKDKDRNGESLNS